MEIKLEINGLTELISSFEERFNALEAKLEGKFELNRYFTRTEAAEYLRISVATLDRIAAVGDIAPAKLGDGPKGIVIYDREDLDEYIQSRKGFTAREADNIIRMAR